MCFYKIVYRYPGIWRFPILGIRVSRNNRKCTALHHTDIQCHLQLWEMGGKTWGNHGKPQIRSVLKTQSKRPSDTKRSYWCKVSSVRLHPPDLHSLWLQCLFKLIRYGRYWKPNQNVHPTPRGHIGVRWAVSDFTLLTSTAYDCIASFKLIR